MKLPDKPLLAHRPRERLLELGPGALTDAELLAIMLRTGARGCNVAELSHALLSHFGCLRSLLNATPDALSAFYGLGQAKTTQIVAISELTRRAMLESLTEGNAMSQPEPVMQYCLATLGHLKIEHCIALYLNARLQLIASAEVARGTLSEAAVYPREIVRKALETHAAAVILAHNHPSGACQASEADLLLTQKVKAALALVDIRLVDHLIVAGHTCVSLARTGQM